MNFKEGKAKLSNVNGSPQIELIIGEPADESTVESREWYRQLVESSPDGIIVQCKGKIVFVNRAGTELLGVTKPEQLIGQPIIDFMYPESREEFSVPGEKIENSPVEQTFVRLDGTKVSVEMMRVPVYYNRQPAVQLIVRDITARKQTEEDIRKREQRIQALIDNTADIIAILDINGNLCYSSPSIVRVLGYEAEHINGKHLAKFAHPDDAVIIEDTIMRTVHRPGASIPITACRLKHRTGMWRTFAMSITNLIDNPAVEGLLINCHDITTYRQTEAENIQRNHELTILQSAGATIASSLDLRYILETVTLEMTKLLGVESCIISEWDRAAYAVYPVVKCGPNGWCDGEMLDRDYHPEDYSVIRNVLEEQTPEQMTINQLYIDSAEFNYMQAANIKTRLILPMIYQRRTVGLIELEDTRIDRIFTHQEITLAQLLANQAASAVENSRLYLELQKRIDELTALNEIGHAMTSTLDFQKVLTNICERIIQLMNAATVSVALFDKAGDDLWVPAAAGAGAEFLKDGRLAKDQGIAGWVFQQGEPQLIPDASKDPRIFVDCAKGHNFTIRSILCAPLQTKGQVIGVITLMNKINGTFDQDDLRVLSSLAVSAAAAIENAQLYRRLAEEQALLAQRIDERTEELSRANAELARAARLKDEFLAGMSHELRTPLNAILGFSEILQNKVFGPLTDKQLKYIKNVEESGYHLLSLINDILDLSKIEAGKMKLDVVPTSVESVCQASMRIVKQLAHKKQLTLSLTLDEAVTTISADERKLKQILVNLLSNAVKFTPEGGKVSLEVRGDEAQQAAHFTVSDTGIGISPEDMGQLFQPFVQLDSGLSRQYAGTGLGLSLVSRMAEMHGGGVSVKSEVGQGSHFTVSLPWSEITESINSVKATKSSNVNDSLRAPAGKQNAEQYSILLVDDNEDNINMLLDFLNLQGYRVIVARNGYEAIEQAKKKHPKIILMDIQMPEMDGLEATRRLRDDAELATTPIIALTALAMPGDRERCLAAGVNVYLSKPVSPQGLVRTIETFLN